MHKDTLINYITQGFSPTDQELEKLDLDAVIEPMDDEIRRQLNKIRGIDND